MSGSKVLIDTNIFINLGSGNSGVDKKINDKTIYFSAITEVELLRFHGITEYGRMFFTQVLSQCILLDISYSIRVLAIMLRKKYKLKTPDAIIAASALELQIPLITADNHFNK